jgi:hypothetical protein
MSRIDKSALNGISYSFSKLFLLFTSHPKEQNMTYFQHLSKTLTLSFNMGKGTLYLFIHAFLPFLFEKDGSIIIKT